jgi:hypothetical protein
LAGHSQERAGKHQNETVSLTSRGDKVFARSPSEAPLFPCGAATEMRTSALVPFNIVLKLVVLVNVN